MRKERSIADRAMPMWACAKTRMLATPRAWAALHLGGATMGVFQACHCGPACKFGWMRQLLTLHSWTCLTAGAPPQRPSSPCCRAACAGFTPALRWFLGTACRRACPAGATWHYVWNMCTGVVVASISAAGMEPTSRVRHRQCRDLVNRICMMDASLSVKREVQGGITGRVARQVLLPDALQNPRRSYTLNRDLRARHAPCWLNLMEISRA